MASSLFTNTLHICFDYVLAMDNPGMSYMGKAVLLYSFEGPNRDRGAVIARSNTNIKSTCWIRTMIRINGTWVIEPCADYWQQIPRVVASRIVAIPSRFSYVDTLPPVSEIFKLLKKRWADVCIEAAAFVVSGKLLLVGSLNFCRAIVVVQPVSVFGFQRPTVTSWGWYQLCIEFFRYNIFSGLLTVDFSIYGLTTVLIRPSLGSANIFDIGVQLPHISFSPASVFAPDVQSITSSNASNQDVQMDIDRHDDSPDSSADSSLHFNENDISTDDDAALDQSILPSSATNISASLAALWESFSKIVANQTRDSRKSGDAHSEVMCKINHVERVFLDSLAAQNEAFRGSFKSIRQEAQNDNNTLSLALKAVRAQNAILSTDLATTQKEVKDLQAALSKGFDDKLADIRNDLLEFRVEHRNNWLLLALILLNSLPLSLRAVMTKRGKAVAAALNRLLMTKIDQVVEVVVEQMTQADMVEALSVEKVVTEVVMVGEEVTVVVLQREHVLTVVVDLVPPKRDAEYWISGKRQF
ncbi:lysM domain receptor-like kinase 3 [Dorcoceras hygrometricum]|uniref:LysM domain receptor-like kinase 3 n=1 Tax=Dorcoceras hygrometricum TaxID=472368 RepID=A0A2Z7DGV2_9LAMI|nr:lysM domain receptor-like kinase 3 [Dorcoceras hygrometricum]